jgi:hypothetical protein
LALFTAARIAALFYLTPACTSPTSYLLSKQETIKRCKIMALEQNGAGLDAVL